MSALADNNNVTNTDDETVPETPDILQAAMSVLMWTLVLTSVLLLALIPLLYFRSR